MDKEYTKRGGCGCGRRREKLAHDHEPAKDTGSAMSKLRDILKNMKEKNNGRGKKRI